MANLHLASALAEMEYPNDSGLPFLSADVLAEPQEVKDGAMRLPPGTGLGIALVFERAFLVRADEARIADDVGGQDGGKTTLGAFFNHEVRLP